MKNIVNTYVERFKADHRKFRRTASLLLTLALIVAAGVFWQLHSTGIALTNETYCGLTEHQHSEDCYEDVLVCGLEESEGHTHSEECYKTQAVLVCGLEESEGHTHDGSCYDEEGNLVCGLEEYEGHTHSEDCYETEQVLICGLEESEGHTHSEECYESQLVCGLEEHTHTVECMSDETADVETSDDWEATLPTLTGVWADDVVAIAESQIGYTESTKNFTLADDGETRQGYTRYGAWAGNEYGDWDAMFASFCLYYAGISTDDFPEATGAYAWSVKLKDSGLYADASEYTPAAGDIVFFDMDGDGKIDSVGVIAKVNEDAGKLTVIEGNYANSDGVDAVVENTYSTDDSVIIGYGVLPEQDTEETTETEVKTGDEAESEAADEGETTTLTYEGESYTVTATFGTDAELPEGVELIVTEYEKDSETYQSRYDEAAKMYGWEKDRFDSVRLFNVGFYLDGEEIEPAAEVEIVIAYSGKDGLTNYTVTHFGEETEEVEAKSGYADGTQTVTFGLGAFSDIMVAGSENELEATEQGEPGDPEAIQALADSGYFEYWSSVIAEQENTDNQIALTESSSKFSLRSAINSLLGRSSGTSTLESQITEGGGSNSNSEDGVSVSKTIEGTDTENVFDITLTVETTTNVSELYKDPDMAVVIVMDISNTMTSTYGDTTRYKAAMDAAENFIDQFAEATNGVSQVGFVAFNTDAHEIFELTSCSDTNEAINLKNTMRTKTGDIISQAGYNESHSRFTNIEAGLKMAADMLESATNENKYIIFLSDGFPTTYISSGYNGYDPYTSSGTKGEDGVFYDYNTGYYCIYGASYSDKAAIRAREMATTIKNNGVNIFSIGVDVGSQTIEKYEVYSGNYSVIDRSAGYTYEIGSSNNASAFKDWLKNSIGSGYYYDSTDENGLISAFNQIFEEIQSLNEASAQANWVATDPLPTFSGGTDTTVEFLGFYNNCNSTNTSILQVCPDIYSLTGNNTEGGENSASYSANSNSISWDLKKSGYTTSTSGSTTTYTYTITYRVRLQNESDGFAEDTNYATNGNASLTYQIVTTEGGTTSVSEEKKLEFPVPEVQGYLGELTFTKVRQNGSTLAGATFTLSHDTSTCSTCRGDGSSSVSLEDMTATSDANGTVTFTKIPSGHTYTLTETTVPEGYYASNKTYTVTVAYDTVTVTETETTSDGTSSEKWSDSDDYTIVNYSEPTVEKEVKDDDGNWVDKNTASIGDSVQFKTTISNTSGADNLVLHDKLSEGLDNPYVSGVTVVNSSGSSKYLTSGSDYTVTYYKGENYTAGAATTDGCSFEIAFKDSVLAALNTSDVIVVYYRADLTTDAVIAGNGNPNETYVSYGTNSYSEHDTTVTYTYEVDVHKYYNDKDLSGAEFILYYTYDRVQAEPSGGETSTVTVTEYAQVDTNKDCLTGWTTVEANATTLTSDNDGKICIKGLAPGTYYLKETKAPDGYNLLKEVIEITVAENGTVSYKVEGAGTLTTPSDNKTIEVENVPGYELPSTGGAGTWMYTIAGAAVCGVAGFLLFRRRKRRA